jgi:anti-anti-sigma factor
VRLDVAELQFIDAAGLSALVQTRDACPGHGGRLILHGVRPFLHRLLAITDLSAAFELEPSLARRLMGRPPGGSAARSRVGTTRPSV